MSEKNTEIVKKSKEPQSLIEAGLKQGASVEVMERLFALHKDVEAQKAKAAFVEATSQFQKEVPVIEKTKKVMNKDGRSLRYQYAPLDGIASQIKDALSAAGLSYRWETKQNGKDITAVCILTHVMGHSESTEFTVSIDSEGFMTAPQKSASALTFAKRYTLLNVLGITTADEDTDATDVGKEKEPKSKKAQIVLLLRRLGKDTKQKETVVADVHDLTGEELNDKNFDTIIEKLSILVSEKEEYDSTKVQ